MGSPKLRQGEVGLHLRVTKQFRELIAEEALARGLTQSEVIIEAVNRLHSESVYLTGDAKVNQFLRLAYRITVELPKAKVKLLRETMLLDLRAYRQKKVRFK